MINISMDRTEQKLLTNKLWELGEGGGLNKMESEVLIILFYYVHLELEASA